MTEEVDDFLAHFGVKGMKWGVRRGADGVRPIARTLNNSKFGKTAQKNVDRYNQRKFGTSKVTKTAQKKSDKYFSDRQKSKSVDSDTVAQRIGITKKGTKPLDKSGNLKRPSYGRELLLGTITNSKARYTDPAARRQRTTAGKLFAASMATGLVSVALQSASTNSGAAAAAKLLGTASSVTGLGSTVYGVSSVYTERKSRKS